MGSNVVKAKSILLARFFQLHFTYIFIILVLFLTFIGLLLIEVSILKRDLSKNFEVLQLENSVNSGTEEEVSRHIARCTFYTCFDVYRCGHVEQDIIKVYVYPEYKFRDSNGDIISLKYSLEFRKIIESIINSQYYTNDPKEACLLVPFVDILNFEAANKQLIHRVLKSLPYWNNGQNHLLFTLLPGTQNHILKFQRDLSSKALVAGSGLSTWLYRPSHDISIPFFNPRVFSSFDFNKSLFNNRKWVLISAQTTLQQHHYATLQTLNNDQNNDQNHRLLLLTSCRNHDVSRRCDRDAVFNYPAVLQQGTFCLVLQGARGGLDTGTLLECMAAGAIPVVMTDPVVLPFTTFIDWGRASVRIEERNLAHIINILSLISIDKVTQMHLQVLFLYRKYFSSIEVISHTSLRVINQRVFPHTAATYQENNERKQRPQPPISLPITVPSSQGFTAVILTYDRFHSLYALIKQLSAVPSLVKMVVVWNNQDKDPPSVSSWPRTNKPIKVIRTTSNKLSNRFYPYKEIETEAVFSLDDDILTLTNDEIEFAFQTWCEHPDKIVGFPSRLHVYDKRKKEWRYESEWVSSLSMVLTAAAFYHKHYSYLYTVSLPEEVIEWVDERMNCEDILFNFMVSMLSRQPPIKISAKQRFKCFNCTNFSPTSDMAEHMIERSACINHFVRVFNLTKPPLVTVEYRADPLLFKDPFPPHDFRRFNELGGL